MAVAVLGVSLSGPLTALFSAPVVALAFWRNAAGAALLLPVLLTRDRAELRGLRWRDLRSSVVAGLFLAAHFGAWLPSLDLTSIGASVALVTTTPIWTAIVARISGVRFPPQVWWGLALAVGGAALIAGVDLTVGVQLMVVYMAILGGIGTAGVPSGSIPFIIGILAMIGIDPALIAIILGVDRILDMCRTTLNVVGDLTAATFVARSEGFELLKAPENAGIG